MCVTDDDDLAERLARIRNHGENVVGADGREELVNMIGFNYRMTEPSAAVGLVQLSRIDEHVEARERLAEALSDGVRGLEGITVPAVREGCRHNYYCWTARVDEAALGVDRETFSRALAAEGFPHATGYVRPLYMLPAFQRRIAFGREGFPFNLGSPRYDAGLCPVTERLHEKEAVVFEPCAFAPEDGLGERLAEAVRKVHAHRAELRQRSA